MNVLLLGSGGREHAFAWKIRQSPSCSELYILPGNGGTAQLGKNLPGSPNDFALVKKTVLSYTIDLVLVGPEEPLILGIRDFFLLDPEISSIPIIGPSKGSAQLEGSKDFSKRFMYRNTIPTAGSRTFRKGEEELGLEYLRSHPLPIVLKADGLAAGKGVLICKTHEEAEAGFLQIIQERVFGSAGDKVVVEEFLEGIEMSLFVLSDGKSYKILPEAKDYKRIGEGDSGLNTGGMGSVSPVPFFDEELKFKINDAIIIPTLEGMREEGLDYFGFLFIGLMVENGNPYVVEYNVRMGDPETQSVLSRMEGDFLELLKATGEQKLDTIRMKVSPKFATTVVSVSGGYPGAFTKGYPITLPKLEPGSEVQYFHAGTILENGILKTNGGRVLAATALGNSLEEALMKANKASEDVHFQDQYFRKDIGKDLQP